MVGCFPSGFLRGSRLKRHSPTSNDTHQKDHCGRLRCSLHSKHRQRPLRAKALTLNAGTTTSRLPSRVAEKTVVCRSILAGKCFANTLAASIAKSENARLPSFLLCSRQECLRKLSLRSRLHSKCPRFHFSELSRLNQVLL